MDQTPRTDGAEGGALKELPRSHVALMMILQRVTLLYQMGRHTSRGDLQQIMAWANEGLRSKADE